MLYTVVSITIYNIVQVQDNSCIRQQIIIRRSDVTGCIYGLASYKYNKQINTWGDRVGKIQQITSACTLQTVVSERHNGEKDK